MTAEIVMSDLSAIEKSIAALPPSDLAALRRWFAEFDFKAWDVQIAVDASAGKLDALMAEAEEDFQSGRSTRAL